MNRGCLALLIVVLGSVLLVPARTVSATAVAISADDAVFQVATVKPARPDADGWGISIQGRRFVATNTSLSDLISYAYGLHANQIMRGPDWLRSRRFDVEGVPDTSGKATTEQYHSMVQSLLQDRFQLAFHYQTAKLGVYEIRLAKSGPKLTTSADKPDNPTTWGLMRPGDLLVRNASIAAFARIMQRRVLDRPVVDSTKLPGRFDLRLRWNPDEVSPHFDSDSEVTDGKAVPGLFTAVREQLGLAIIAARDPVRVMAIDHAEPPSAN